MGQATRTTKLFLDLGNRAEGGANSGKRAYLEETAKILDAARAFYVAFFLTHPDRIGLEPAASHRVSTGVVRRVFVGPSPDPLRITPRFFRFTP
jgi:hypothetical protein